MTTENKRPPSVKVFLAIPDPFYEDKYVERKVRITISEYEAISRLSGDSATARILLSELEDAIRERPEVVEDEDAELERQQKLASQIDELRNTVTETSGKLLDAYSKVIVGWNLTDDDGEPLPDPYRNAEALGPDVLSMDEYRFITEIIQDSIDQLRIRAEKTLEGKNSEGS